MPKIMVFSKVCGPSHYIVQSELVLYLLLMLCTNLNIYLSPLGSAKTTQNYDVRSVGTSKTIYIYVLHILHESCVWFAVRIDKTWRFFYP